MQDNDCPKPVQAGGLFHVGWGFGCMVLINAIHTITSPLGSGCIPVAVVRTGLAPPRAGGTRFGNSRATRRIASLPTGPALRGAGGARALALSRSSCQTDFHRHKAGWGLSATVLVHSCHTALHRREAARGWLGDKCAQLWVCTPGQSLHVRTATTNIQIGSQGGFPILSTRMFSGRMVMTIQLVYCTA